MIIYVAMVTLAIYGSDIAWSRTDWWYVDVLIFLGLPIMFGVIGGLIAVSIGIVSMIWAYLVIDPLIMIDTTNTYRLIATALALGVFGLLLIGLVGFVTSHMNFGLVVGILVLPILAFWTCRYWAIFEYREV